MSLRKLQSLQAENETGADQFVAVVAGHIERDPDAFDDIVMAVGSNDVALLDALSLDEKQIVLGIANVGLCAVMSRLTNNIAAALK